MILYAKTIRGRYKLLSEDAVLCNGEVLNESTVEGVQLSIPFIIAIADGLGGHEGGHEASRFVLQHLAQIPPERLNTEKRLYQTIQTLNRKLIRYGYEQQLPLMATTLSGLVFLESTVFLFHIGDTRIYAQKEHSLSLLTKDHTTYQWYVDHNDWEKAKRCSRTELYACLGAGDERLFQSLVVKDVRWVREAEQVLLTSDGIHDFISNEEWEEILHSGRSPMEQLDAIINRARQHGSGDDCSIAILKYIRN